MMMIGIRIIGIRPKMIGKTVVMQVIITRRVITTILEIHGIIRIIRKGKVVILGLTRVTLQDLLILIRGSRG